MVLRYLDTAIGFAVVMLLLSLLITAFVQSIVGLFNLRGKNLQGGLELLLGQIGVEERLRKVIATEVLIHPSVATPGLVSWSRRATAIRVEELFRVLRQLGLGNGISGRRPTLKERMLRKLGRGPSVSEQKLIADAQEAVKGLVREPLLAAARLEQLATDMSKGAPAWAAELRAWMTAELGQPEKVIAGVSDWFDCIMDRTSQRFAVWTRWISIGAAIALTVILRLDTPGVLNRIWSNAALREQLVAAAPEALQVADTMRTYEKRQRTLATSAILAVRDSQQSDTIVRLLANVPELGTYQDGARWLDSVLKGHNGADSLLASFRSQMALRTDSLLRRYQASSRQVRAALADPAIGIFQTPLPPIWDYWWNVDHAMRGLISVVLLSLGAPFWYNMLKRGANLRPIVAQRVEEETEAKGG
jgi:hypothetical protein